MRWVQKLCVSLLCFSVSLGCLAQATQPSGPEISTIEIDPQWSGHRDPSGTSVIVRRSGNTYQRIWHTAGSKNSQDEIAPAIVQALLVAVQAPSLRTPSLENLGITRAWLNSHAEEELQYTGNLGATNGDRQHQFFRDSFTDVALVRKLLPGVIAETWTDDGAWVHVSITFSNGSTWTAETTALTPFMLPWTSTVAGRVSKTYNADISRAVANLLPEDTVNRKRLIGTGIERLLGSAVGMSIKAKWQEMGAEDRAGAALATLKQRYVIRRSEVSDYQGLGAGEGFGSTLQADVRLANFPENLVVATIFPIHDGTVEGLDSFFLTGSKYERLVLSNPWIMKSLHDHSDLGAWLYFVPDASLSEKALRVFNADMKEIGKENLTKQVTDHRMEVALLNYYGNQLILFPDHHAIIWRWGPYRDLFSWKAASLKTQRCSAYNTSTEGCAGAIVSSDGVLER